MSSFRRELRDMIAAGRTDERIRVSFIERCGQAVLIVPNGKTGRWLVAVPLAGHCSSCDWGSQNPLRSDGAHLEVAA